MKPNNDANKREFQRLSMKLLREVRDRLAVDADVRYNRGGIAVSGDATLHGDSVYVSLNADGFSNWILYRECRGRDDYVGLTNRQFPFNRLAEEGVDGLVAAIQEIEMHRLLVERAKDG